MATLFDTEDAKKIIMSCPNEDTQYKPPNMDNNKYAYVTLVMLGDSYISGAIVLAKSLDYCQSKADKVVLVTPDVSNEGKEILSKYFDLVKVVPYIRVFNWRGLHKDYLNLVFTKFHCLELTQYKKILLIDADAIVLKHPDHLFSLNTPAGIYLSDKNLIISYDNNGNYILPKSGEYEWYNKFCNKIPHGSLIPKDITDRVKREKMNSGMGGGLMLLEPRKGECENIVKDARNSDLVRKFFVWPEQQFLTVKYSGKWHSINPRFFGLQGYPHWKVLFGLQYGGDKPFVLNFKFPNDVRIKYPDFILWHTIYHQILKDNPEFMNNNYTLKEVNDFHKLFDKNDIDIDPRMLFDSVSNGGGSNYDYINLFNKLCNKILK